MKPRWIVYGLVTLTFAPCAAAAQTEAPSRVSAEAAPVAAETQPMDASLKAPEASGSPSTVELDRVVVSGVRQQATVARQDVPLKDLPQSITIVPGTVLEREAAKRLTDIAYDTVNLQPSQPFAGASTDGGFSRGFNANLLLDGYKTFAGITSGLGLVERVEVLRGPTSVLYGLGDPGGALNLVLKRPRNVFGARVETTYDSVGTRLLRGDVTGPVPGLGTDLSYRLVYEGENSDTFRDFGHNQRQFVAPMLRWQPTEGTRLDLLGAYDRYKYHVDRDFIVGAFPTDYIVNGDLHRSTSEPTLPLSRTDSRTLRVEGRQRLTADDAWAVTAAFFHYDTRTPYYSEIRGDDAIPGTTLLSRHYVTTVDPRRNANHDTTASLRVNGDVSALGTEHRLLAAVETVRLGYEYNDRNADYPPLDYLNPTYQPTLDAPPTEPHNVGGQASRTRAAYVNDLITLAPQWKAQLGLRYDQILSTGMGDVESPSITDRKLSPAAGVVYQPTESTSAYASYGTSFVPQFGRDRAGAPLRPERSRAYEIGLKQELLGRRLVLTGALFTIEKRGILQTDPTDVDFVLNGGTARSDGFELEAEGRPARGGPEIRGGVGYARARIVESTDFPVGTRIVGPSPLTARFSLRQPWQWQGIGYWASAGVYYGGRREVAAPANGEQLPSFTRVDLAAAAAWREFEVQVNLKNLLNQRILLSNGGGILNPDNPRTYSLTLRYRLGGL